MSVPGRLSRDDWKKQKDLEEARKAGTAPAEVDEDGNEINPHIPQYISQAPWYLNKDTPSLKHQKSTLAKPNYDTEWYIRGAKTGPAATKFRKGACQNCGAMTHKAKDCCERPRKIGAKWTGKDIQPDELTRDLKLDYDGKRDRWNGYDAEEYNEVIDKYDQAELERRKLKKEAELAALQAGAQNTGNGKKPADNAAEESDSDSEYGSDDDKADFLDDESSSVGVKKDPRTRTTVRNLRIREDTAKYLRNLNPDSAHYDPKSRSLRDNPNPNLKPEEQVYAGDNFVRQSGDVKTFLDVQNYAFNANEKGQDIHLQAAPSQAELMYKEYQKKKEMQTKQHRDEILSKYGGEQYLQAPPKALLFAQSEEYVEYAPDGSLLKGGEKVIPRSKYEEDVYFGNHKSVWGSYWEDGQWGYACCHSLTKNSYCTGESGKNARKEIQQEMLQSATRSHSEKEASKTDGKQKQESSEKEANLDNERDDRKRRYNSLTGNYEVSEKEMEDYMQKRKQWDDPMRNFVK